MVNWGTNSKAESRVMISGGVACREHLGMKRERVPSILVYSRKGKRVYT